MIGINLERWFVTETNPCHLPLPLPIEKLLVRRLNDPEDPGYMDLAFDIRL